MAREDPLAKYRNGAVETGAGTPIPLVSTRILARIRGGLAVVTTERLFRNAESRSIEATITFPVHATLVDLRASIDGRTLSAKAQRKAAARETYEAAIDDGKTAVLHEEVLRGVLMISVGHVPAGKEIAVISTWGVTLTCASGEVSLGIPTTVGDIYGRSPLSDSDDLIHGGIIHKATLEVASEDSIVTLLGGQFAGGRAEVSLDTPIELQVTSCHPRQLRGVSADGREVILRVTPAPAGDDDLDAEVLFDGSGSMATAHDGNIENNGRIPSKYDVALRGLADAAGTLRPRDRIRLWQFTRSAREIAADTGPDGLRRLAGMLEESAGGTLIGASLLKATENSNARDVVVITDGNSHDIREQALSAIGKRFTLVLIGEDSLEARIGHLAARTGGEIFVTSGADVGSAIRAAFNSIRTRHVPPARIDGPLGKVVTRRAGMLVEASWRVPADSEVTDEARVTGAVAAALAIPCLDEGRAVVLDERHGICCYLTSLVLVDDAGERQEGLPAQRKVALSTPRTARAYSAVCIAGPPKIGYSNFTTSEALLDIPQFLRATRSFDPRPTRSSGSSRTGGSKGLDFGDGAAGKGGLEGPPPVPVPPRMPAVTATPPTVGLRSVIGRVDWGANPDALLRGEIHGAVPLDVVVALNRAAIHQAITALAQQIGADPLVVALALLARAEQGNRAADRVFRTVLGKVDAVRIAEAMGALGL
jgi:hypothetical protein